MVGLLPSCRRQNLLMTFVQAFITVSSIERSEGDKVSISSLIKASTC